MLPYWPADPFHRELTLLKYGGKSGAQILNEMHEKGTDYYSASNAGEDDVGDLEREAMEGPLRGRRAAIVEQHRELRSSAPSNTLELPAASEEESLRIDEPSNNHKKRKSAGAASRSGHEDRLASSSPARGQHSSAANRLLRELGARSRPRSTLAEVTEDDRPAQDDEDGIERPDVSSATFRASRLVDDLYSEGMVDSEDTGHDEELDDADHPLCDARLSRATRPTHEDVKLLYRAYLSREPWSQRHRDRIREKIKSRLVLKRAVDAVKEEQAGEIRKAETKSAEGRANRDVEKKPSTSTKKLTKAEQRVKAAKGSSSVAGLKKPTLAEIRARTMGAQGKQSDLHKSSQTSSQPITPRSFSPAVAATQAESAAVPTRCPPLRGDFTMQCPSPISARLQQSRQVFSDLLAQPFDQVMSQLRLPNVLKDKTSAWPSIGSTLLESRIPMLSGRRTEAAGQSAQSQKWFPSTVSSTGELSRLRSDFAGLRIRSSDKDKATAWAFDVPVAAKQRQASGNGARPPSALPNKASTLPTQSPPTSAGAITDKQTDDSALDPRLPGDLSSKPPASMANARTGPATIPPAANARQSSATPSIASPPIPSSPKVPKMSRRRKANMHNPHHVSNSSKWLPSQNSTGSNVRRGALDADHQPPGLDHPTTTSALFPDEFICMFCEYELFYGKKSRLLKACKCRKERLRKEKAAREGRKTGRKNLPRLDNSRIGALDGGSTNDGTSSVRDDCCCDDCREHALQEAAASDRGVISSDFAGDGLPPLVSTDAVNPSTLLPSDVDDTANFADAGSLLPSMATTTAKKNVSRMIAAIARSPYVRQRLLAELAAMADLFPDGDASESSGQADQEEMRKWIEELGHLHPTEDVDGESDLRWLDSKVAGEDEALRTLPRKFFEFFGRVLRDQQAAAKETSNGRRSSAPEL